MPRRIGALERVAVDEMGLGGGERRSAGPAGPRRGSASRGACGTGTSSLAFRVSGLDRIWGSAPRRGGKAAERCPLTGRGCRRGYETVAVTEDWTSRYDFRLVPRGKGGPVVAGMRGRHRMATGWAVTSRVLDNLKADSHRGDPFAAAVRATRMPMIVTDPRQHDNPIVFANDSFLKLTGYTRMEVTGRNCRFLQGPETDPVAVERLREAIRRETTSGSTSSTTARTARPSRTPCMSGPCGMRTAGSSTSSPRRSTSASTTR